MITEVCFDVVQEEHDGTDTHSQRTLDLLKLYMSSCLYYRRIIHSICVTHTEQVKRWGIFIIANSYHDREVDAVGLPLATSEEGRSSKDGNSARSSNSQVPTSSTRPTKDEQLRDCFNICLFVLLFYLSWGPAQCSLPSIHPSIQRCSI